MFPPLIQVQREMRARIEEQGRKLNIMLDQQQITNKTLIQSPHFDLTSSDNQSHNIKNVANSKTEEFLDNFYNSNIECQMCVFYGHSVPSHSSDFG